MDRVASTKHAAAALMEYIYTRAVEIAKEQIKMQQSQRDSSLFLWIEQVLLVEPVGTNTKEEFLQQLQELATVFYGSGEFLNNPVQ